MAQKRKKKNEKKLRLIMFIAIIIIIIAIIFNIPKTSHKTENNKIDISGTYIYDNNVKYVFEENGIGAMYNNQTKYEYHYSIDENKIKIDFENSLLRDATYTFSIENDVLTLVGEEGTTGGKYLLKKEAK